jgi:methyl coenzyme M reductase gamma subunit
MDRDRIMELLIQDRLEKLGIGQHSRRFLKVVEREFRSLGDLTDEELVEELARRGIAAEFDALDEPIDEPDEENDEDEEEEVSSMLRDLRRSDEDWVSIPG